MAHFFKSSFCNIRFTTKLPAKIRGVGDKRIDRIVCHAHTSGEQRLFFRRIDAAC